MTFSCMRTSFFDNHIVENKNNAEDLFKGIQLNLNHGDVIDLVSLIIQVTSNFYLSLFKTFKKENPEILIEFHSCVIISDHHLDPTNKASVKSVLCGAVCAISTSRMSPDGFDPIVDCTTLKSNLNLSHYFWMTCSSPIKPNEDLATFFADSQDDDSVIMRDQRDGSLAESVSYYVMDRNISSSETVFHLQLRSFQVLISKAKCAQSTIVGKLLHYDNLQHMLHSLPIPFAQFWKMMNDSTTNFLTVY